MVGGHKDELSAGKQAVIQAGKRPSGEGGLRNARAACHSCALGEGREEETLHRSGIIHSRGQ